MPPSFVSIILLLVSDQDCEPQNVCYTTAEDGSRKRPADFVDCLWGQQKGARALACVSSSAYQEMANSQLGAGVCSNVILQSVDSVLSAESCITSCEPRFARQAPSSVDTATYEPCSHHPTDALAKKSPQKFSFLTISTRKLGKCDERTENCRDLVRGSGSCAACAEIVAPSVDECEKQERLTSTGVTFIQHNTRQALYFAWKGLPPPQPLW